MTINPAAAQRNTGSESGRKVLSAEQKHATYLLREVFAYPSVLSAREELNEALDAIELAARLAKVTAGLSAT